MSPPPRRLSLLMLEDALNTSTMQPLPPQSYEPELGLYRATSPETSKIKAGMLRSELEREREREGEGERERADPNRSMSKGTKWHHVQPPVVPGGSKKGGLVLLDEDWSEFQGGDENDEGKHGAPLSRGRSLWNTFSRSSSNKKVGVEDEWDRIEREHREAEEAKGKFPDQVKDGPWEGAGQEEEFRRPVVLEGWNADAKKVLTEDIAQGVRPSLSLVQPFHFRCCTS